MKKLLVSCIAAHAVCLPIADAVADNAMNQTKAKLLNGVAVRYDKSEPLPRLIQMTQENSASVSRNLKPADYVYPNFTEHPSKIKQADQLSSTDGIQNTRGASSMPPVGISFDGIGQADAPGGGLPPDTNGDVGIDHYVQYINTDWGVYSKTTGQLVGSIQEGNTFWAGFGGSCETDNAGDPIVLFDKLAQVWVFSQFISSNNGSQCFAVSDRADITDPNVTFNRYEFSFNGDFNDYPHIGIWTDENGDSSGYYFVTHDFDFSGASPVFVGASFSVVERDAMIAGNPAEFVRFQNVTGGGSNAYGALPAHLEGDVLPAGNTCAPFVHTRADLDAYLFWNLCVDWDNTQNSTISDATIISSAHPYSAGVNNIPQPSPAPAGSELDSFSGRTMYRASARAYPSSSGLPIDLVINHVADTGGGVAGVKWVNFSLSYDGASFNGEVTPADSFQAKIRDEGTFSPDDDYRWMGAISIDRSRNLGLAYSVSSENTFPSVRYTGRTTNDPIGTLRDEAVCVDGTGVQTFVDSTGRAGRWGDYSSMSVDPVDQCTFWATVEYIASTGVANWDNRICSFKFPECGDPIYFMETQDSQDIEVCLLDGDPSVDLSLYALDGFNSQVSLSTAGMPGSSSVNFSPSNVNTYPASVTATFVDLDQAGSSQFVAEILATGGSPTVNRSLSFNVTASSGIPVSANLSSPANSSVGTSVRPVLSWLAAVDALNYTVEIATDAAFTNIVETGTVSTTSYAVVNPLAVQSQYYWRVVSENNCGNSVASQVFNFTTGTPGECAAPLLPQVYFSDDIEGDVGDWSISGLGSTWAQSSVRVNSGQNSFFAVDSASTSDQYLVTPPITLPSIDKSPITLSFWNYQNMEANSGTGVEACWDGGLLEVSTDGGNSFVQVSNLNMLTDPYNGGIVQQAASEISGLDAWCADDINPASGDQETTAVVDLNQYAGQQVQFRFRLGTDGSAGDEGWYIDDIAVQGCATDLIFENSFE